MYKEFSFSRCFIWTCIFGRFLRCLLVTFCTTFFQVLSSWSMLGYWSGNKLLMHNVFLLVCILWALHNKTNSSPGKYFVFLSLILFDLDYISDLEAARNSIPLFISSHYSCWLRYYNTSCLFVLQSSYLYSLTLSAFSWTSLCSLSLILTKPNHQTSSVQSWQSSI